METRPDKAFWIPFGIAGACVGVFSICRFSEQVDSWNLLIALSLGFAIAAFPWVSGFKIKGLLEIQRQIDTAKGEVNTKIQQTDKESGKRVDELRREVQYNISTLQAQINQNLVNLTSSQRSSQITYVGHDSSLEVFKTLQDGREKDLVQKAAEANLPVNPEETKLRRLKSSFSLACAHALVDLPNLKCAKLLRAPLDTEVSKETFDKSAALFAITPEQIRMMQTLGLLEVSENREAEERTIRVQVTDLGTIYANHWAGTIEWAATAKNLVTIVAAAAPIIAALWGSWVGSGKDDSNSE